MYQSYTVLATTTTPTITKESTYRITNIIARRGTLEEGEDLTETGAARRRQLLQSGTLIREQLTVNKQKIQLL